MRAQKEMRKIFLETGGKGILCYAVAGSLGSNSSSRKSELCPIVIRKAEHISSELGCFAEISKQRTGYATWFLLVVYGKI